MYLIFRVNQWFKTKVWARIKPYIESGQEAYDDDEVVVPKKDQSPEELEVQKKEREAKKRA